MASSIELGGSYLHVANRRLFALIDLVLQVGREYAQSGEEREFVERLRHWYENETWPGIDFPLDEHFPTVAEKKFWARCFFALANWIFWRKIDGVDGSTWQTSTIGDAYIVARLLTRAVQEIELAWHPAGDDSKEEAEWLGKLNVKF